MSRTKKKLVSGKPRSFAKSLAIAAELTEREQSFRLLFDSNPVPMIVCAPDSGLVLSVNDAAIEHYG
ncbi:MAG: PAS domain-containing protein, partial [Pseudolabrys sp.]